MRKEALLGCVALAAALFAGPVIAGPIPWSYQAETLGVPYNDPINGSPIGPRSGIDMWSGNSGDFGVASIIFDNLDPAVWQSDAGKQSFVATKLNFSAGVFNPSASFEVGYPAPGDYTLTLRLRDDSSGRTGQLTFRGLFSGDPGWNFPLQHQFVGPTTGTLDLGEHVYTVTLGPVRLPEILFTNDGMGGIQPGSYQTTPEQAGEIDAQVKVVDSPNAPEPTTLALAGLGLLGAAAARGWRRRTAVA